MIFDNLYFQILRAQRENMYRLDLSDNRLTCEVGSQIGYLNRICALNLSYNNLTAMTLSNLKQIESLNLSYNNLNVKTPHKLVEINSLAVFLMLHIRTCQATSRMRAAQFATFKENSCLGNEIG